MTNETLTDLSTSGLDIESRFAGDGYDYMGEVAASGWKPVAGWGRDGWDLLSWPYYIAFVRNTDAAELGTYCEGDLTYERFATNEERQAAIDKLALFGWTQDPESCGLEVEVAAVKAGGEVPGKLLGPYGAKRCEVCDRPLSGAELRALNGDSDFVEHHGHLIRSVA